MPLTPIDEVHALQIQAGTVGRKAGHSFEDTLTKRINELTYPMAVGQLSAGHVFTGEPGSILVQYVARALGFASVDAASAISTGALATSEEGKQWLSINGASVSRCKSDVVLTLSWAAKKMTVGVSTKQCNNTKPTNAQLFFTTARGFVNLLRNNCVPVSDAALNALRQFCGDVGYRPSDNPAAHANRQADPRRFFWEEIDATGRAEWETIFRTRQAEISRLLFQRAYLDDAFPPDYLLHKTKCAGSWTTTEVAVYSIDELIRLSGKYQGYATREYCVRKGSHRDPVGVCHLAPRFGVIQMQRGGQRQHPEQLQFNLEAGYFYKI